MLKMSIRSRITNNEPLSLSSSTICLSSSNACNHFTFSPSVFTQNMYILYVSVSQSFQPFLTLIFQVFSAKTNIWINSVFTSDGQTFFFLFWYRSKVAFLISFNILQFFYITSLFEKDDHSNMDWIIRSSS